MAPDLIDRAKRGDKEAFTALVVQLGDRLYSVAYRILRDAGRAEDAVQQTFLIAWRELPSLRDESRLEAWLYRLLVNACYAELRHTRRWQPGLRLVSLDVPSEDDAQLSVADRDELERAFRRLSGEQRAVLVLHHYVGLSGAEIGTALGLSPGTVRSRLHYARQLMRAAIEADARSIASGGTA
jgi:RNA polymerase sigma-70 factor (ECF subfamily)